MLIMPLLPLLGDTRGGLTGLHAIGQKQIRAWYIMKERVGFRQRNRRKRPFIYKNKDLAQIGFLRKIKDLT
jgi:hypothetical protein